MHRKLLTAKSVPTPKGESRRQNAFTPAGRLAVDALAKMVIKINTEGGLEGVALRR